LTKLVDEARLGPRRRAPARPDQTVLPSPLPRLAGIAVALLVVASSVAAA
jgi:hypothetical protein